MTKTPLPSEPTLCLFCRAWYFADACTCLASEPSPAPSESAYEAVTTDNGNGSKGTSWRKSESAEPLKADPWTNLKLYYAHNEIHVEGNPSATCLESYVYLAAEVDAAHAADTATIADLRAEVESLSKMLTELGS